MTTDHPQPTPFYRIRQRAGPAIDRLAHSLGQREYVVCDDGYVGTVPNAVPAFETTLRRLGFSWDPLSLYHHTPTGRTSDGSWTYRKSVLADRQLHVVLFERESDRLDMYAHEEPSWVRHPLGHARMNDIDRERGVDRLTSMLDSAAIEYEQKSDWRKRLGRFVDRFRATVPTP